MRPTPGRRWPKVQFTGFGAEIDTQSLKQAVSGLERNPLLGVDVPNRDSFCDVATHLEQELSVACNVLDELSHPSLTSAEPASLPVPSGRAESEPQPEYVFRLRGEHYEVRFGEASALLAAKGNGGRYLLGPRYIAALLAKPDHAFTSLDLWVIGTRQYKLAGNAVTIQEIVGDVDDEGRLPLSLGLPESRQAIGASREKTSAGTELDSTEEDYRNAIHRLEDDLAKADDEVEKAGLRHQITEIRREIGRLHSPTGRLKALQDKSESRRKSIRQAIQRVYDSIDQLETPVPGLKDHLRDHILMTGDSFRYGPSAPPLDWQVG